tara:strand:+ start:214 stop:534 length:321 start_codon:yes stop_codon:yes gene_type:complete
MAIIKYSLDNGRIPSYISDGGHFINEPAEDESGNVTYSGDYSLIGIGSGGGTELTKSQLLSHVLSIHAGNPWTNPSTRSQNSMGTAFTNAEMTTQVNAWCTARGIS